MSALRASMAAMIVETRLPSAVRVEHLSRRRPRGRSSVLRRRGRARRVPDRGGRASRADAHARAAHPPPLRPRVRGGRAARALAGARGPDQPARARHADGCRRGGRRRGRDGHGRGGADAAARNARGAPAVHAGTHRRDALVPGGRSLRDGGCQAGRHRTGALPDRRRPAGSPAGEAVVFTGDTLFKNSVGGVQSAGSHHLHRPEGLDHGHADGAAARHDHLPGPRRPEHRRTGVELEPASSASGAAWTRRAPSPAPRSASPPRWCCSATTTTAARRPGCAGRTARTTSCPGRRSSGRREGRLLTAGPGCRKAPTRLRFVGFRVWRARARRSRPRACSARRPSPRSRRARPSSSSGPAPRTSPAARTPPTRRCPGASWRPPSRSWRCSAR